MIIHSKARHPADGSKLSAEDKNALAALTLTVLLMAWLAFFVPRNPAPPPFKMVTVKITNLVGCRFVEAGPATNVYWHVVNCGSTNMKLLKQP